MKNLKRLFLNWPSLSIGFVAGLAFLVSCGGGGGAAQQAVAAVANLWTQVGTDIHYSGGNVGIGTATNLPLMKLHVQDGGILSARSDDTATGIRAPIQSFNVAQTYIQMEMSGSLDGGTMFGLPKANLGWLRTGGLVPSTLLLASGQGDVVIATGVSEKVRVTSAGDMKMAGGYVQLATVGGVVPLILDCDQPTEYGRMKVDEVNALLYVCAVGGWVAK